MSGSHAALSRWMRSVADQMLLTQLPERLRERVR
jgi:hypothetical protein